MKIPFTFGLSLFYRLLIPGFILALACAPAIHTFIDRKLPQLSAKLDFMFAFPIEILLWGWLITLLHMHIYQLFEGRRLYWPRLVSQAFAAMEARRLDRILRERERLRDVDPKRSAELAIDMS